MMLHGSEKWRLGVNEMILKRTAKAMIRAMGGVKLIEKRSGQELIALCNFGQNRQSKWSAMVWRCFEEDSNDVSRKALKCEVAGRRGLWQSKVTQRRQVDEKIN